MLLHFTKVPQQSRSAGENASTPQEKKAVERGNMILPGSKGFEFLEYERVQIF